MNMEPSWRAYLNGAIMSPPIIELAWITGPMKAKSENGLLKTFYLDLTLSSYIAYK